MNTDFNCCISFVLLSVDKVTTGTQSFASVIANVVAWFAAALDIKQLAEHVKMRWISQLMAFQEFSKNYLNISMVPLF